MATAQDILRSVSTQIPDVDDAGDPLYSAFAKNTLLLWINDASRIICAKAPVIHDWTGVASVSGQDVYLIGELVTDVLKGWYNLLPLTMDSEGNNTFVNKVEGTSWWLAPHLQTSAGQYYQIWPAPSLSGGSTTLTGNINSSVISLPITDSASFNNPYGFLQIDSEIMRYANLPAAGATGNITNIIRGMGGTVPASHLSAATVNELNLMFQVTRLPMPLVADTDIVEIPRQLWPLIELYVISKIREAEQQHDVALQQISEFNKYVQDMANKAQLIKPRQGLQVRVSPMGPLLFNGRTYVP